MDYSNTFKKLFLTLTLLTTIFIFVQSPNTYTEEEMSAISFLFVKILGIGMLFSVLIFTLLQELRILLNALRSCLATMLLIIVFIFVIIILFNCS